MEMSYKVRGKPFEAHPINKLRKAAGQKPFYMDEHPDMAKNVKKPYKGTGRVAKKAAPHQPKNDGNA